MHRIAAPEHFADSSAVVLVDEVLPDKLSPDTSPVGQRILIRLNTLEPLDVEIIGVVRHQRGPSLAQDGTEGIYVTHQYAGTPAAWRMRCAPMETPRRSCLRCAR